jgi:VanZ family protein
MTVKTRIAWWMVICWTGFIFSFSLVPADASSQQSQLVTRRIEPVYRQVEQWLHLEPVSRDILHHQVRKMAHGVLYLVLGILMARALMLSKIPIKWGLLAVLGLALVDEGIQMWMPGRGSQWQDVLIDTGAAWLGVGLWAKQAKNHFVSTTGRKIHSSWRR